MKILTIKILYILCLLLPFSLEAATFELSVPDTLIPSGKIYNLPVNGKINNAPQGNLSIILNFNARSLDIKSIRGSNLSGLHDEIIAFKTIVHAWDSVDLQIETNNYSSDFSGNLFYMEVESLVGPDTLSRISLKEVRVNDSIQSSELSGGLIITTPPLVNQEYVEGIGVPYPNPFNEKAKIPFIVEKDSPINFKIYSYLGRLIDNFPLTKQNIDFQVFNNKNEEIFGIENKTLLAGNYYLTMHPKKWEVSSGPYYVIMETKSGVYKTNFIYVK